MAPRHLKIGVERAYTIIYYRLDLFLRRSNYAGNNVARNRKEALQRVLQQHLSRFIAIQNGFNVFSHVTETVLTDDKHENTACEK